MLCKTEQRNACEIIPTLLMFIWAYVNTEKVLYCLIFEQQIWNIYTR